MQTSERIRQEDAILHSIETSLAAYDTVLRVNDPQEHIVYASSPITTGRRMYDLFEKYMVASVDELKQRDPKIIFEQIMNPNIRDGHDFAVELNQKHRIVIAPGDFFAKGWTQEHYMSLWEQVIVRFAGQVHFNKDWAESNGCAQEFLIGLQSGKMLHERGKVAPLTQKEGATQMRQAIGRIDRIGADPKTLYDTYRRIELHKPRTVMVMPTAS